MNTYLTQSIGLSSNACLISLSKFPLFSGTIDENLPKCWPKCLKMSLKLNMDLFFDGCSRNYDTEDSCTNLDYLSAICKIIPIQIIKLDRMGLKVARNLAKSTRKKQNIKIIYLVRDPRAVINSRKSRSWCVSEPICMDSRNLCEYIFEDHHVAKGLLKENILKEQFRYNF